MKRTIPGQFYEIGSFGLVGECLAEEASDVVRFTERSDRKRCVDPPKKFKRRNFSLKVEEY